MTIKNLHPTSQKLLLGVTLFSAILFTSCSRTLTSMSNTDKLQNQQELFKPSKATNLPLATTVPEKQTEQKDSKSTVAYVPETVKKQEFRKWADSKTKIVFTKTKLVKTLITTNVDKTVASIQGVDKNKNTMSANHSAHPMRDLIRTGIMCLIISLVLYLLAYLLFFADPISWLFYVLATIFFVAGILFLLFGLLRMM